MTRTWVSLHHHTTFSFLDGYGLPEAHVRRAAELDMSALAITEHGNVSSHSQLEQAALAQGVKPIFGCELYCGAGHTQRKNHLTVLAEDSNGYRNLLKVVSAGWSNFYYEPTVDGDLLSRYKEGLVVLSGCTGSLLATSLVGGKNVAAENASYSRGLAVARRFKRALGDSFYLEVQSFPELEVTRTLNPYLERISRELGIPLVATGDCHYTIPTENEMQQILHNVRGGNRQTLEDQARAWGYDVPLSPVASDSVLYHRLRGTGLSHIGARSAIVNAAEIAERCTVTLPKLDRLRYPIPEGFENVSELWKNWIKRGWDYRGCARLPGPERSRYKRQLAYEMDLIERKDFVDYFLLVADIVTFAKDSGIPVGPARGSAAASLVCWLLRITEVNPMVFPSLVFERFIDITREDLPDIDLDFDSERRHEIEEYAVGKYGRECVGKIGTFSFYKSKVSLDDVARVYKIPKYEVDTVKNLLLERSSGDLRASATIEDTVAQFEQAKDVFDRYPDLYKAMLLEGNVKGMGIHAAGLVVAPKAITDVCAVYSRKDGKGVQQEAISLDKKDAERQGLMKIDILGLSTMTMIAAALRMLDMRLEELYAIPLDDPKIIEAFQQNDIVGIFQFDGRAMRSVNAELCPDSFQEICDINALARPGPLHSGSTAEYIDVKRGRKEPTLLHPVFDRIVADTHYQVIYQEQILRVVREVGGFDWTHAAYIRKIISKKLGEQEFNRQWEQFWSGAQAQGIEEPMARGIWSTCITAGAYAFNSAHSVSYGMLAWWTMWLKVYHPQVFYVACLQKYGEDRQLSFLRDAARHSLDPLVPDPMLSDLTWAAEGNKIRAGLVQVPGIGAKTAGAMLDYRATVAPVGGAPLAWQGYTVVKGIGPKTIEKVEEFCESDDPFGIHRLHRLLDGARDFIRHSRTLPNPTHTSLEVPYSRGQDVEVVWVGVITARNLRDLFESHYSKTGEVLDPESIKDPTLREWVVSIGEDEDETLTVTWNRWEYPRLKKEVWDIRLDEDVVLIRGRKRGFQARRAIYVNEMWILSPRS